MPERQDLDWISDIKEAIARVEEYTAGIKYQEFLDDKKTQDAVVRNIGIIGEAAQKMIVDPPLWVRIARFSCFGVTAGHDHCEEIVG